MLLYVFYFIQQAQAQLDYARAQLEQGYNGQHIVHQASRAQSEQEYKGQDIVHKAFVMTINTPVGEIQVSNACESIKTENNHVSKIMCQ